MVQSDIKGEEIKGPKLPQHLIERDLESASMQETLEPTAENCAEVDFVQSPEFPHEGKQRHSEVKLANFPCCNVNSHSLLQQAINSAASSGKGFQLIDVGSLYQREICLLTQSISPPKGFT